MRVTAWSTIRVKHNAYSVPVPPDAGGGAGPDLRRAPRGLLRRRAAAHGGAAAGAQRASHQLPARHLVAGAEAGRVRALPVPRGPVSHAGVPAGVRRAVRRPAVRTADLEYLRILHLAASTMESEVARPSSGCSRPGRCRRRTRCGPAWRPSARRSRRWPPAGGPGGVRRLLEPREVAHDGGRRERAWRCCCAR